MRTSNGVYYIILDPHGTIETTYEDEDRALSFRARNPDLAKTIIPVVDLNRFSHGTVETGDIEEVVSQLDQTTVDLSKYNSTKTDEGDV